TVLTAARTGEVVGARWGEIDLDNATWTVPASRIKAGREHRVPLSPAAMQIITTTERTDSALVFPGLSQKSLYHALERLKVDATTHGFRATFSTWAAEQTSVAREIVEAALAHAVEDKVEAAYKRTDFFQKRAELMIAWSRFCAGTDDAAVVPMRRTAR